MLKASEYKELLLWNAVTQVCVIPLLLYIFLLRYQKIYTFMIKLQCNLNTINDISN